MTKINLYDSEWEEINSNKYNVDNMNHLKIECFDNYYYYKKIDGLENKTKMTENFQTIIKELEIKLGDYRYDNEIEITKAKLETAKQLKELVKKAVEKFRMSMDAEDNYEWLSYKIEELRKSLGVEDEM